MNRMVPALAVGFEDVMKRMDQQDRLSSAHNNKLQVKQPIQRRIMQNPNTFVIKRKLKKS
jgi:hypothetical protein